MNAVSRIVDVAPATDNVASPVDQVEPMRLSKRFAAIKSVSVKIIINPLVIIPQNAALALISGVTDF